MWRGRARDAARSADTPSSPAPGPQCESWPRCVRCWRGRGSRACSAVSRALEGPSRAHHHASRKSRQDRLVGFHSLHTEPIADALDPLTTEVLHWLRRTRSAHTSTHRAVLGSRIQHAAVSNVVAELHSFGARPRLEFVWSGDGSCVADDQPRTIFLHYNLS